MVTAMYCAGDGGVVLDGLDGSDGWRRTHWETVTDRRSGGPPLLPHPLASDADARAGVLVDSEEARQVAF